MTSVCVRPPRDRPRRYVLLVRLVREAVTRVGGHPRFIAAGAAVAGAGRWLAAAAAGVVGRAVERLAWRARRAGGADAADAGAVAAGGAEPLSLLASLREGARDLAAKLSSIMWGSAHAVAAVAVICVLVVAAIGAPAAAARVWYDCMPHVIARQHSRCSSAIK